MEVSLDKSHSIDWNSTLSMGDIEDSRVEEIAKLRNLLTRREDVIDLESCDDSFLLSVLQARRFNLDNAFDLVCTYFEFRKKNQSVFANLTASELRYAIEDGFPCILPYTDSHNARIMVVFPGLWDIETFDVDTIMKTLVLSLEYLSRIKHVRENGIVLMVDFSGWTTNHTTKFNISYLRKIIAIFQECFPVWFKNIHIINQPWYINAFITVIKPFLIKDNVQDRIVVHGNNMATLHEFISPDNLPAEFGGNKSEVDRCYWATLLLEAEKKEKRKTSTIRRGRNPFGIDANTKLDPGENEQLLSTT